jgi:hypothetical protein
MMRTKEFSRRGNSETGERNMKRLRTLCAVVGAAILCTTVTLATEYEVPPYTLEGAEKKITYGARALGLGGICPVKDPSQVPDNIPLVTIVKYGIDRNKDGRKDLVRKETTCQGQKHVRIFIDDDYDGYVDREVTDRQGDGIYDAEYETSNLKIEEAFDS